MVVAVELPRVTAFVLGTGELFLARALECIEVVGRDIARDVLAVETRAVKRRKLRLEMAYRSLECIEILIHEGIGSDFAPSLKGLNEFKCKFTEEITPVAPARDVPIKKVFYKTLQTVQGVRKALR